MDLAAWKDDAQYLRKRGSCTVATQTQAQRVMALIAAIEQKDAALREQQAWVRLLVDAWDGRDFVRVSELLSERPSLAAAFATTKGGQ